MICPQMSRPVIVRLTEENGEPSFRVEVSHADCLKGECAWWSKSKKKCAVVVLAQPRSNK